MIDYEIIVRAIFLAYREECRKCKKDANYKSNLHSFSATVIRILKEYENG